MHTALQLELLRVQPLILGIWNGGGDTFTIRDSISKDSKGYITRIIKMGEVKV